MATHLSLLFLFVAVIISGGILAETSRKELRTKEVNQERIIQLGRPLQSNTIDPSRVIQLSWRPSVLILEEVHDSASCGCLFRSGYSIFTVMDDEVVARIEERISAWSFLPKKNGRPIRVLHFELEDTKKKYDYLGNVSTLQLNEPVIATMVLYLSNVNKGGQILFPKSENNVWSDCMKSSQTWRPTKGNAILFFNLHLDATPDGTSSHARCPIIEGEMWCATKIFYLNPVSREKVMLQVDDGDCIDEDENCPRWAATGECKRNPVFMIGSTDYYGTCRKSCNAC